MSERTSGPAVQAPQVPSGGEASPDVAGRRQFALLEIALFLVAALVLDGLWGQGDRFAGVEPHPFWVIVLLMAVQYGTAEALLATAASTVALLAWNLPPQTLDESVHDYVRQVLLDPLLWMLAAVVLGELRGRHRQREREVTERLRDSERKVTLLSRSHDELSATKERLETRLAGEVRTATNMFEAARALESLDPARVLDGVSDLLEVTLQARAYSLFLLEGDALELATARGWPPDASPSRRYPPETPLFRAIVGAQRVVSVATPEGEGILHGDGLMAGPLLDRSTGKMFGMLKIEEMAFLDFNLSSLHTFTALCGWIASAYGIAVAHKASAVEDEATLLYGMSHLERQAAHLTEVARRFGFDLTLLTFRIETADMSEHRRRQIPAALGEVSRVVLRGTDLVFGHQPPSARFAALLPGATAETTAIVVRKLVDGLREACGEDLPCTTQVRVLCRAAEAASRQKLRGVSSDQVA